MILRFLVLILFIFPTTTYALTKSQESLLRMAHVYGSEIGYPETIQAILLQESSANINIKVGDIGNGFGRRSYGVMQIKLTAAREALKHHDFNIKFKTNEELLVKLISDPYFNIVMGTIYFNYLLHRFKNWSLAVVAYNRGPGWVIKNKNIIKYNPYLSDIRNQIYKIVRPFNQNHKNFLAP